MWVYGKPVASSVYAVSTPSLAERLGHSADAKLVILSCDDLGAFHAANVGVYDALRKGSATCASLMVPAPWARHAVMNYNGEDIGVHLTVNSEHEMYRWGPLTYAPSLQSGEGGFMPLGGSRIPQASIDLIIQWQNEGFAE